MNTQSVDAAVSLLLALINNAAQISALVGKAQSEGRTDLTADEWATVIANSDASAKRLQDAINAR